MLKLSWLGSPVLEIDGAQIHFETRKVAALLAYLSLSYKANPREKIATLLWPECDQSRALANLRRALGSLTHCLPAGYLLADRDTITWNETAPAQIDVREFQSSVRTVRMHPHDDVATCDSCLHRLEEAANLYQGDFLDGLNLPDCPDFDDWQLYLREELRRDLAGVLERLARGWMHRSAWDQAVCTARRWVALDNLAVDAQIALVDIYIHSGQRLLAQRQFEEYAQGIKGELGQALDAETIKLFQQLLNSAQPISMPPKSVDSSTTQVSPALIKSKLYLPSLKTNRISRTSLLARLDEITTHKMTLISAPAGFGKTSLLADWVTHSKDLVAWLSLDKADNDPVKFFTYICAALDSLVSGVCTNTQAMLEGREPLESQSYVTLLLNDLEKIVQPIILVLDDYQFINNRSIHEACTYLVDRAPANFHLVIASRADPLFPLARLRAQGDLLEIRTDDLRFTLLESETFFRQVMQLDIASKDIQTLAERTEGWAVGLQMAALSMRERKDIPSFIKGFSGTNRYILDYLLEEVLANQSSEIQQFLLCTSILERLTAPLCEAVLEAGKLDSWVIDKLSADFQPPNVLNCQPILEYLERANLFLEPMDDERIWYRYHHLFADLLRTRLQQTLTVEDIAVLHTRAAQWYTQSGLNYEAIHHASLTSNNEWVEQLIEQNYMEMFHRGEATSMRSWTGKLSKELIYRRPWLCIYEAQSYALFGHLDQADELIAVAEKHLQSGATVADTQAMRGHLAYVKSRVTGMRGDVQRAIELSLIARQNTPASNQALQSGIGVMLGVGYFLDGDFGNAFKVFSETIQSGIAAKAINGTVAAYCHLARLHAIQGQLHKSYELYQEAGKFAHGAGGQNLGVMSLVDMGIANVLYELNDLENAHVCIKRGLELIHLWGNADDIVLAYTTHARIQLAQGNIAGAVESIEKGIHLIQTRGVFSFARDAVRTAQVRLWLAQGDLHSASHWAASEEERLSSDMNYRFENEQNRITLLRVYLAQKAPDEAIRLLSRLEESAESGGRKRSLIEILILKALTLQILGETAQALATVEKCLSLAEPEKYIRIFVNEDRPLQRLLVQWSAHAREGPLRNYSIYLLSQFDAEPRQIMETQDRVSPNGDLVEPLTPRELEVLKLLCEGLSNQAIADKLIITVKTVKKHTGNILGKLGVTSRAQAMVKARQIGLFPK